MKSKREKFQTRTILLVGERQRETLLALARNLPVDADRPLEIIVREQKKQRGLDANALYWCGPIADIASQAWLDGRQYSPEVWHFFLKKEFLPEVYDAEQCKEGYAKWELTPTDERILVGSTTDLTVKGFSIYLEQVFSFGANLGVQFKANPKGDRHE